jgi:acetyl esterase/lipase
MLETATSLLPTVPVVNTSYTAKLVPGQKAAGILDPHAKTEITPKEAGQPADPSGIPNVQAARAAMGWPTAHYTVRHPLTIENTQLHGVGVRTYVQKELAADTLPAILFIHGGGFFGGSLDNVEQPCRLLADEGRVRVISVDYGLAPEHPYPQDVIDSYNVLTALHHQAAALHIDAHRITIMGDSAGGNLTYVVSLLDRQLGTNYIASAVALYPVTYQGHRPVLRQQFDDPAHWQPAQDQDLITNYIRGFAQSSPLIDQWYVGGADPESWYISPLNAPSELLAKLPRTLFMVGEFDPLRFQGEAFYNKVKAAGGDIRYIRYNGMVHAFMDKVGDYEQAADSLREALRFIAEE